MAGNQKSVARVAVVDDMTVYNAAKHKATLIDALTKSDVLELDLSGVGEIDSAGFQLLTMAKREAERLNKKVVIVSHSASVSELLDFLGMVARFGDPVLVASTNR